MKEGKIAAFAVFVSALILGWIFYFWRNIMKNIKSFRTLTVTAIMSALGFVLMLLEFPLPMLIPSFIKFDFSELPAIITSFVSSVMEMLSNDATSSVLSTITGA